MLRRIDDEIELGWRLRWQIARICAFQDAVHIVGRPPEYVGTIGSVGHQSTVQSKLPIYGNCGELETLGQLRDHAAVGYVEGPCRRDQAAAAPFTGQGLDRGFECVRLTNLRAHESQR